MLWRNYSQTIFYKIKFEHISGSTVSKVWLQFVFIVRQVKGYWNVLKLSCRPLAFTSYKAFLKNKKRSATNLPGSFSAWLLKKNISCYLLLPGCLYFVRYWTLKFFFERWQSNFKRELVETEPSKPIIPKKSNGGKWNKHLYTKD